MSLNRTMFDTVAGKLVGGPYSPKDTSRNAWETLTRDFYDVRLQTRRLSVIQVLNRSEARIAILADGSILRVEASLPKLLYGNNLKTVSRVEPALHRLHEFVSDFVGGMLSDFSEMDFLRVDYCHNFKVGSALPDYVRTLSKVPYLKHRATTDDYDGVEWWGDNGRKVRVYDKYHEILETDKRDVPEARGVLRFEVQIRKKAKLLQRRIRNNHLTLRDVLDPAIAYCTIAETLNRMCLDLVFVTPDAARKILDEQFPYRKATRLLGIIRRLETQTLDDVRDSSPRSTFYADKRELRRLGLWPPAASKTVLPGLSLPLLEDLIEPEHGST